MESPLSRRYQARHPKVDGENRKSFSKFSSKREMRRKKMEILAESRIFSRARLKRFIFQLQCRDTVITMFLYCRFLNEAISSRWTVERSWYYRYRLNCINLPRDIWQSYFLLLIIMCKCVFPVSTQRFSYFIRIIGFYFQLLYKWCCIIKPGE